MHVVSKTQAIHWSASQIRITGEGPDGALIVDLDKPYALIGAHPESDLVLKGSWIARRHLYLHATDRGIFCVDLAKAGREKSLTGEWIGNDPIRVGSYKLQFGFVSGKALQGDDNFGDMFAEKSVDPPYPLMVCSADDSPLGNRFLTRRLIFVGRDPGCSLQIVTRSLSPQHCVIYQHAGQVWIVDLRSTRKTRVDGQAINVAELADYSVVSMGRVSFFIQKTAETDSRPRWAQKNEGPDRNVTDFEQPIGQLQIEDSHAMDVQFESSLSPDIHDSEVNFDLSLPYNELPSGSSDVKLQRDEGNEDPNVSVTFDREFVNDGFNQKSPLSQIVFPSNDVAEHWRSELDEMATELDLRSEDLDRQQRAWQSQQSKIEKEMEQQQSALLHQQSELEKRKSELQNEQQRFHLQIKESTTRSTQRRTELDIRETDLVKLEIDLEKARALLQIDREKPGQIHESEKSQLRAQITALQVSLREFESERRHQIASLEIQLADMQRVDKERQSRHERDADEFQQLRINIEEQKKSWLDEKRKLENEQQAAVGQLQQELAELTGQRLEIQKELEAALQNLTEFEGRVKDFADVELRQNQLANDQSRLEVERVQFEEQMKQDRADLERHELEFDQRTQRKRDELEADHESLISMQKAFEQELAGFQQRQQSLLVEHAQKDMQSQVAADQLREWENRLVTERSEIESQELAGMKKSTTQADGTTDEQELVQLRYQLEVEESQFAKQQAQWLQEQKRLVGEEIVNNNKLEVQLAELATAREKLESDQFQFERNKSIGFAQQQVLVNLKQLKREKSTLYRLWLWLIGRSH